ncbi:MAG: TlyA family RNA methyltransferase [Pseudomonadota bacterium]
MPKTRLDQKLVDLNFYRSRSRARDAVLRGSVTVNGVAAMRPSQMVANEDNFEVRDAAIEYVSRAALKLEAGLEAAGYDPDGKVALDIGASTGGFSQILLERGASHIFAVDVGHDQMDARISSDPRVTNLEGINARNLTITTLGPEAKVGIGCVVCDVSFISLKLALPPALALVEPDGWGIFLVKPQFELGREHLGKGGIVRDREMLEQCSNDMACWLDMQDGWRNTHLLPSPIEGSGGNQEFLLCGMKDANRKPE